MTRGGNNDNEEESNLASGIAMAVAAVAGVAMLAWGVSKLVAMLAWGVSKLVAMLAWGVSKLVANNSQYSPKSSPGFFTLQYFGSDRNQLQKARAGCIIRNREEFIVAGAYNLNHQYPDCNIAIAEAIALWNGLKLAKDNNVKLDLIQGRNPEVRGRVLDLDKSPPKSRHLDTLIGQIKGALNEQGIDVDEDILELVEEEESIKVARALAVVGGKLEGKKMIYDSVNELPSSVADLMDSDSDSMEE